MATVNCTDAVFKVREEAVIIFDIIWYRSAFGWERNKSFIEFRPQEVMHHFMESSINCFSTALKSFG